MHCTHSKVIVWLKNVFPFICIHQNRRGITNFFFFPQILACVWGHEFSFCCLEGFIHSLMHDLAVPTSRDVSIAVECWAHRRATSKFQCDKVFRTACRHQRKRNPDLTCCDFHIANWIRLRTRHKLGSLLEKWRSGFSVWCWDFCVLNMDTEIHESKRRTETQTDAFSVCVRQWKCFQWALIPGITSALPHRQRSRKS